MPPISNAETIPNFPLNGHELATYALLVFERVCEKRNWDAKRYAIVSQAFQAAMENDWHFKNTTRYGDTNFEISVQSHAVEDGTREQFSFTLEPTFRFPLTPLDAESKPFVRRPVGMPAPPLEGFGPNALHFVDCFTAWVKVDNPNLVRVHCNMPIVIQEKVQPAHGEMFGKIKNHEIRYDPAEYEALPEPVVVDRSAEFVKIWRAEGSTVTIPEATQDRPYSVEKFNAGVTPEPKTTTDAVMESAVTEMRSYPSEDELAALKSAADRGMAPPPSLPKPPRRDRGKR